MRARALARQLTQLDLDAQTYATFRRQSIGGDDMGVLWLDDPVAQQFWKPWMPSVNCWPSRAPGVRAGNLTWSRWPWPRWVPENPKTWQGHRRKGTARPARQGIHPFLVPVCWTSAVLAESRKHPGGV